MKLGDTFVWCPPGTVRDHLWIIISDPSKNGGKFVVVNLTESLGGRHAFTLMKGQHRWIYKDSDVNFGDSFVTTVAHLEAQIKLSSAIPHDPMDLSLLQQIIKAAKKAPAMAPAIKKYLE